MPAAPIHAVVSNIKVFHLRCDRLLLTWLRMLTVDFMSANDGEFGTLPASWTGRYAVTNCPCLVKRRTVDPDLKWPALDMPSRCAPEVCLSCYTSFAPDNRRHESLRSTCTSSPVSNPFGLSFTNRSTITLQPCSISWHPTGMLKTPTTRNRDVAYGASTSNYPLYHLGTKPCVLRLDCTSSFRGLCARRGTSLEFRSL